MQTASRSDLIDLKLTIHATTERAVLVSEYGDEEEAVWLPLSQIEVERNRDGTATVTLPEWLAIERELV